MSKYTLLLVLLLLQGRQDSTLVFVSRFLLVFFSALFSIGNCSFPVGDGDYFDVGDYFDPDADYMSRLLKALNPTPPRWSENTSFCQWNGVNCSQPHSRGRPQVNAISLPSSSLSGELPQDLNSLSQLTHLDLHNNYLSGSIPPLAKLSSLETVYLSDNSFTSIPSGCFLGLTALQTLNLSNNPTLPEWSFPTELVQSRSLRTLELANMNIVGELPAGMFDWFPSLQSVDLSSNKIGGSLPESLGRSQITHVRLNDNYFKGPMTPIPDLSNCTNLSDLQLRFNSLTGLVPPSLMALPSLQNVALDDNNLQGPIPVFSRKDVKATWKWNNFCRNDSGPCDPRVTTLLEIAAAFGYPLDLAQSWQGNDPCEKENNWTCIDCEGGEIVTVNFGQWNYSGTVSPAFANLTSLRNLTLSGNNLTGSIPQSLTSLSQLEILDVSNNDLIGQVPKFSPKVKLNTKGNVNLVGFSRGAGDASPPVSGHRAILRLVLIAVASVSSAGVVILIVIISTRKRYFSLVQKRIFRKGRKFVDHNVEAFMQSYNLSVPKRYSYAEIKRITNSFRDKLGQGGYGVVYKASLPDGRHVAVKVINESKGNGEEFINEVASISKTSHVNIVSLLGFCYEMNKRALIYEFMLNGSLDKFIYRGGFPSAICNLDCNTLFQIAIGIARGLEYLHQGCTSRILHLDIKPQNILLDEDFCPKISDFGLAKICQKKGSIVSMQGTRGTIGYIAPEVFSRTYGGVSHKSDVYSYGMLILEMIGGRKNHDSGGSHTTEMYFPDWIYRDLEQGHTPVNCLAMSEEENDMVRKITMVSLWCIQMNPLDRPPMSKVIEMLQEPLQSVPYPPKLALYSPERPSLQTSSYVSSNNLSERNSTILQENGSLKLI